jgi:hypothetical protein
MYIIYPQVKLPTLIPVAAWSKSWVCAPSLAVIADSNPAGAWVSVVIVVRCQVEVSGTGRCLVQRSPTECAVSVTIKPRI